MRAAAWSDTGSDTPPGAWVVRDETLGAFVVSGYDEAARVLREPGWSSDPRRIAGRSLAVPPGVLLFLDPPDHTRLRRLLSPAFTPRAVGRLRPRVAAIVDTVLSGLFADADEADLMAEAAYLVPLAVIAELLDVGAEGARVFREHTPGLVRMLEAVPTAEDVERGAEASQEVMMFLLPLLVERRRAPGGDFVGALAATDGLSLEELLATCVLLLAAGHETTANLIGNGASALLRDRAQIERLHADPARAVEELLRAEPPVRLAGRVALTDHELGGVRVPAGSRVVVRIDAANRDPRRFADPGRLDLSREPLPHLAFGGGHHYCLGAALARLEAAETLTRLFGRFPDLAPAAPEPRRRTSTTFNGWATLPVRARRSSA
ncbi:cytochrome P450 [Actinomadura harenae]|uniref:Cytochrome P450 n=1 Tax=Actinomadura harenae TaxID=2483351 RepID=A0A3M2M589_9ACTN|nr:cytochrome P450 [Actinomadura harenae]RMI42288.1 cytochrome P450 [Actinomadura harenae]